MRLPVRRRDARRGAGLARAAALVVGLALGPAAAADPLRPLPVFTDAEILDPPPPYFHIESVTARFTHFDQTGTGYQSRAGSLRGPGKETLQVEEPQLEIIAKQGDKITHRIWVPIDIVTAASPDAVDLVATASRQNEAGGVDWTMTYQASHELAVFIRNGVHDEENYGGFNSGAGLVRSFAEDNTTLSASVNQNIDVFDFYRLNGGHLGHLGRSGTNLNAGLTQLLSPTTVAHLDYGFTVQRGQLSNTWNIVPLTTGDRRQESLPPQRLRHALVGRVAQFLPWNGALHAFYRFYDDDWGIRAHTMELELYQRLSSFSYLRLNYRYYTQAGARFFTTLATPGFKLATSDSDLAPFDAHTIGVKGSVDIPTRFAQNLHADASVERYFRSNDLRVSVYSFGFGLLF
jgi:hypothetical protein